MKVTEKDPTGVAAAVSVVVMAVAAVFNAQVDDDTASNIGVAVAAIITLGSILAARRKAWAPDTVRAVNGGVLPEVPPDA